ncbi:MAG: hypothetical protein K0Q83_2410 [Deltaproteobacteria bacterium]|jgi:hypothetical protein|nr:hypothetical protein [Deltaproteobacteria bacterium]
MAVAAFNKHAEFSEKYLEVMPKGLRDGASPHRYYNLGLLPLNVRCPASCKSLRFASHAVHFSFCALPIVARAPASMTHPSIRNRSVREIESAAGIAIGPVYP